MSDFSVCVFCGARPGKMPSYMQAAEEFGLGLARENWRLVYGAGDVGLMGAVARAAQSAGAETFGVIPQHLVRAEVGKRDLTSYIVTENMHERKKVMFMNSDAIAVLPGGGGSLDEFFEVLTWAQLGLHRKPILLVNVDGYWDDLVTLLKGIIAKGFADESVWDYVRVVADVPAAFDALRAARSRAKAALE